MRNMYERERVDVTKKGEKMKKESNHQPEKAKGHRPLPFGTVPKQEQPGSTVHPLNRVGQISYSALSQAVNVLAEAHLNVLSASTGLAVEDILGKVKEDSEKRNTEDSPGSD